MNANARLVEILNTVTPVTVRSRAFTEDTIGEERPAWEALGLLRDRDIDARCGEDRWPTDGLLAMEDAINDVMLDTDMSADCFNGVLAVEGSEVVLTAQGERHLVGSLS